MAQSQRLSKPLVEAPSGYGMVLAIFLAAFFWIGVAVGITAFWLVSR